MDCFHNTRLPDKSLIPSVYGTSPSSQGFFRLCPFPGFSAPRAFGRAVPSPPPSRRGPAAPARWPKGIKFSQWPWRTASGWQRWRAPRQQKSSPASPKRTAHDAAVRSPFRSILANPIPTCRSWLVQKVVAMGIPSAWRKVLYCMEAMKFTSTCTKWWGQERGINPMANKATHSKATR